MAPNREQKKKNINFCGAIYDLLAQLISILDVVTDLIVCVGFYLDDRMVFFGLSLTILILALVSYDALFVYLYSGEHKFHRDCLLFAAMFPISPFIPFIFFYAESKDSCLSILLEKLCCLKLKFDSRSTSDGASKLKQFFETKIVKHAGFIIESLVEGLIISLNVKLQIF